MFTKHFTGHFALNIIIDLFQSAANGLSVPTCATHGAQFAPNCAHQMFTKHFPGHFAVNTILDLFQLAASGLSVPTLATHLCSKSGQCVPTLGEASPLCTEHPPLKGGYR